uniref:Uncharacterized protein n=1 Tax=Arundo donax TaxID=35708 RepID=A0A0A9F486_ARUDO
MERIITQGSPFVDQKNRDHYVGVLL